MSRGGEGGPAQPPQVGNRKQRRTLRLAELVKDHDVVGVVEVLGQSLYVPAAQSVGHEDSSSVSVRPVDTILRHKNRGTFRDELSEIKMEKEKGKVTRSVLFNRFFRAQSLQ